MSTPWRQDEFGRRHGVWVPLDEVEACLLFGWSIADDTPHHDRLLMREPFAEASAGRPARGLAA